MNNLRIIYERFVNLNFSCCNIAKPFPDQAVYFGEKADNTSNPHFRHFTKTGITCIIDFDLLHLPQHPLQTRRFQSLADGHA